MKNDLVSIIIPTLNEAENISNCLNSIKKQKYKNFEIIVVDNQSTDKTTTIAGKFTPYIYTYGPERSSQRNYGASKAKGKYLLFLDADMQVTNNCIKEAIQKIRDKKNIIAFPEKSIGQNFWGKSIAFERNLYQKEKLLAGARLLPEQLFAKLKGFDENLIAGEDWDITLRARKLGYKLVFTDSFLIHRENAKNLKEILKKKAYYSQNINLYAAKHPLEFSKQSSFRKRLGIFLKHFPTLLANPLHTFGFIFIKCLVWYDWQTKGNNEHSRYWLR